MSDPRLGLTMLGLIVVTIMMGFPTAFTLMGLGMIFGYIAFWDPSHYWWQNHIFDLIVQRTYGVMTNDTLLSIEKARRMLGYQPAWSWRDVLEVAR